MEHFDFADILQPQALTLEEKAQAQIKLETKTVKPRQDMKHESVAKPTLSKNKSATSQTTERSCTSKARKKAIILEPYEYPLSPIDFKICGIDEAGRGPLMGNVVAACVVLNHKCMIAELDDSKRLSEKKRDELALRIKDEAIAFGIGEATPQEIDELNILNATFLAMRRAYEAMGLICDFSLIDGNKVPKNWPISANAVVKGDARVKEIAAASILAKTTRDQELYQLDQQYPDYAFAQHKGYPTQAHLDIIARLPILSCYRKSYGPVKAILEKRQQL